MKISLSVDWIFKGKKGNHFTFVCCSSFFQWSCQMCWHCLPFQHLSHLAVLDCSFPSCNMSHDLVLLPSSWRLWIVCNHDTSGARRGWRCDSRAICSYTNFFSLKTKCTKGHNGNEGNAGKLCRIAWAENVLDFYDSTNNNNDVNGTAWVEIENLLKHYSTNNCEIIFPSLLW